MKREGGREGVSDYYKWGEYLQCAYIILGEFLKIPLIHRKRCTCTCMYCIIMYMYICMHIH